MAVPTETTDDKYESLCGDTSEVGARVSLTLRNVKTFMDATSNSVFGQGVDCKTIQEWKRKKQSERLSFCLCFGSLITYSMQKYGALPSLRKALSWPASSLSPRTSNRSTLMTRSLLGELAQIVGVSALALWSYNALLRLYHKRKDEKRARDFFTSASTSGTKY